MVKLAFSLAIFLLFVVASEIQGKSINRRNIEGFVHLGSFRHKSNGAKAVEYDENDYYISVLPATWNTARANCKFVFDNDAVNLVALESEEESIFVNELLENFPFVGTLWTSGTYTSIWKWDSSGVPLAPTPWAPWKGGNPPTSANSQQRVALAFRNRDDAVWQAQSNTKPEMYICEVPRVDVPVPCYDTNDLVVVLDSSGSIGAPNYALAKEFVAKLASAFTVHAPSRLALIVYSSISTVTIPLNNALTPAQVENAILNAYYESGNTYTDLGINAAVTQFTSNSRIVPLNMVVLTDGHSNDATRTAAAAQLAATHGIRSFSVGITPSVDQMELLTIAGGNPDRVFTLDTFDDLIKILTPLSVRVCSRI